MYDTLIMFLTEFFEKVNFENNQQTINAWKIAQHAKILFDLILYVPSTIFQLYRDGWVFLG